MSRADCDVCDEYHATLNKQIDILKAALIQERANKLSSDGKAFHDYTIDAAAQLAKEYPEIFAEIKRLRVLECAAKANMTRRDEDIGDLMKELVKWQQIAIDRTAQIG